jgi:hypothetical protein
MEDKKMVKRLVFIAIILFFILHVAFAETPWKIKAEKISFNWETQFFEAEGNVEFSGKDILIRADRLEGSIREASFKAEGNVYFKDKEGEFFAENIEYFYREQKATIKNVKLRYNAPESKEKIYIKGENLDWKKGNVSLKKGNFTTCSYENPHYFLSASQIEYYPNDRIVFINVIFFLRFPYPAFYLPIFYVPYYVIPLTKEPSPFPQIGYDSTLGLYLTYPFTYNLLGLPGVLTFLISQNQGIKFSLSQKYSFPNLSGNIDAHYLYNYNLNTDELKFNITGKYALPPLSLNFNSLYLSYPYSGNYSLQNSVNVTYTSGILRTNILGTWNNNPNFDNKGVNINTTLDFNKNLKLQSNIRYNNLSYTLGSSQEDLQGNINLDYNDTIQRFYIYANERWTNTTDLLLKKIPEFYYSRKLSLLNIPSKLELLLGNYIEPGIPFTINTWKIGFSLTLSPNLSFSTGKISSNLGFRQEFYGTQDARYLLFGNVSYSYRLLSLISGSLNYNFQWLGKDIVTGDSGNTPFYFDYLTNINNISAQTTIGSPNINLSLQQGYNFINNTPTSLSISGILKIGNVATLSAKTSYLWNTQTFTSIFIQGSFQNPNFYFSFGGLYDLNANMIKRVDYRLGINITGDWHYAGKLSLLGYYLPTLGNTFYSLSLEKDLHCFNMKATYYFATQSFQFSIYLKAFPSKGLELTGRPEGFTLLPSF